MAGNGGPICDRRNGHEPRQIYGGPHPEESEGMWERPSCATTNHEVPIPRGIASPINSSAGKGFIAL